jgi:aspartate-semialdehyde dehydrogenase
MNEYTVAVVGATGLVGSEMIAILEERQFPVRELRLLASTRSLGKKMNFRGESVPVHELTKEAFEGVDIALFSAGAATSKQFAPIVVRLGAVVIDNSSAFRMEQDIPLVVPEVNPDMMIKHPGIIANPNCSTIQMVVVLNALRKLSKIKRVVVSTYQAVSGWGNAAVDQLWQECEQLTLARRDGEACCRVKDFRAEKPIPYQSALNMVPQIDVFMPDGYTKEEHKMLHETRKILGDESLKISVTCVRVPVVRAHSEAVNIEFQQEVSVEAIRELLSKTAGVKVVDDAAAGEYPMPAVVAGKDDVYVGRIRKDESLDHGVNLWIVADNLRKGAALNAVQIAEEWGLMVNSLLFNG